MKADILTCLFIFYSLLIVGNARRFELRFRNRPKKVNVVAYSSTPEYRSLNEFRNEELPTEDEDEDEEEREPELLSSVTTPSRKKLLLVKGRSNDVFSGRTFKHLLLLRGLGDSNYGSDHGGGGGHGGGGYGGGGHGGGGNGGSGSDGSIFYLYSPLNLTIANNNSLANTVPPATTGTGGGAFLRKSPVLSYISNAQAQPLPVQIQQPTPVYQQRDQHNHNSQMPFDLMRPAVIGMLGRNGEVIPMMLQQSGGDIQGLIRNGGNRRNNQRRRGGNQNSYSNGNPFMNFRDNLKNFQFF